MLGEEKAVGRVAALHVAIKFDEYALETVLDSIVETMKQEGGNNDRFVRNRTVILNSED